MVNDTEQRRLSACTFEESYGEWWRGDGIL